MAASKRIIKRQPAPAEAPPVVAEEPEAYDVSHMTNGGGFSGDTPDYGGDDNIRGGWGASQETIDSTSSYAQAFRPGKDTQIIRFMEGKPYAAFRRHWIDRPGIGKRAYTCFKSIGKECPVCKAGDKPGAVTAFNIALLSDDGEAVIKSWECGVKITQQLKTYANDPKIGPLDRPGLYFAVSKSEATTRQQVTTMVNPVRERDLLEDWATPPIDPAQIPKLMETMYTADIVDIPGAQVMEEVAAEFAGGTAPEEQRGWGS
jgi:hypothetical protein